MEQYRSSLAPRTQRRSQNLCSDVAKIQIRKQSSKYFGRKIFIPTLFSNFSPFSFFNSNLILTFANDIASRVATLAHQPA